MEVRKVQPGRVEPVHPTAPARQAADKGDEEKDRAQKQLPKPLPAKNRKKPGEKGGIIDVEA